MMPTPQAKPRARRKNPTHPPIPPTTPEFRAEAHARLDRLLDTCPGSDTLLLAVDGQSGADADSVPSSLTVKTGMVLGLFRKLFPEGV